MIHPDCFQRPWLDEQAQRCASIGDGVLLLGKCMVALELVGRLSALGLTFVFKGGTSLVLHLEALRRLSIDADIITPEPLERVQAVLREAVRNVPFSGVVIPQGAGFVHQIDEEFFGGGVAVVGLEVHSLGDAGREK